MKKGWIKLYRDSLNNPVFQKPLVWHYFEYCLLKACHEDQEIIWNGKKMIIERGSFVTGRKKAAKETGLSEQNIRTALDILGLQSMVVKSTTKSTNKFTYLTVCNYEDYQALNEVSNQESNQQSTSNQPHTRMYKNDKNNIYTIFDFWNSKKIILHREIEKYKSHIAARLKNYSLGEIKEAISNYSTILEGDEYFFSYKWGLDEFLSRKNGLDKFLTANDPFANFKKSRGQIGNKLQTSENAAAYEEYNPGGTT